jgi:hypothetical protein
MPSRLRDRLERLEAQIAPQSRIFVFFRAEELDLPPYAEQLEAFKAEKGIGPHDTLVTVAFTFDLTASKNPQRRGVQISETSLLDAVQRERGPVQQARPMDAA